MYYIDGKIAEAIWPELRTKKMLGAAIVFGLVDGLPVIRLLSLEWADGTIEPFPAGDKTAYIQAAKINETEVVFEGLDGDPGPVRESLAFLIRDLGLEAIQQAYKQKLQC